jgi:hypothetical protein
MGCFKGVKPELSQRMAALHTAQLRAPRCANELDKVLINETLNDPSMMHLSVKLARRKDNGDVETGRDRCHCGQGMELFA